MADQKISALTGATTPLAGTEVLPIVQSGVTKKVSVADLTAGRTVAAAGLDVSSSGQNIASLAGGAANGSSWYFKTGTNVLMAVGDAAAIVGGSANAKAMIYTGNAIPLSIAVSGAERWVFDENFNLVQKTASKGINFTANTPAAGMTSQLLNWYEEGTFTPTITSGTGTITTLGDVSGKYTRIGNKYIVNVSAVITTNGTGAGYILMSNLPTAGDVTQLIGSGNENAITGKALTMSAVTTTSIAVTFYDSTYPGANGASLRVCLVYQA